VQVLSVIGLAFLLFLAGLEIDVRSVRGRPLRLSLAGYAVTLAVGVATGIALQHAGWVSAPLFLAVTLSATSLGLVVPVLKDAGRADLPVGQLVIAAASVADFGAVLLLSLFFSGSDSSAGARLVLLGGFGLLVAAVVATASRAGRSMRLGDVLTRLQDTTAEIRVRACVALLLGFVALAARFGLETILGAFVAGAVVAVVDRDSTSHPHLRTKLEALGYGFLVPTFFVASGLRLDLHGLLASPAALARVPVLLLALLAARGLAALPLRATASGHATAAAALLQATSLPFIVTATQIGVATGRVSPVTAAALVCAGLLSVLLFPAAALALLRREPAAVPAPRERALL
jgi:Kef-type K+ transport system membrane component KefB